MSETFSIRTCFAGDETQRTISSEDDVWEACIKVRVFLTSCYLGQKEVPISSTNYSLFNI